jgi:protease-4
MKILDMFKRNTRLALLLLFGVFSIGLVMSARWLSGGNFLSAGEAVAVIPLFGPIVDEDDFIENLTAFREDDGVQAFIIKIESPGGTVGASQSIYEAIRDLRDEDERPVIAWMGDVAASGGYYAAMGADSVFALPGTITGSIGVLMEFPNAEELFSKVGLNWQVIKSGEFKDMGSLSRPLSDADRRVLEVFITDVYEQFVEVVAANRPLGITEVRELADGRIYSGRQAEKLGLIDDLSTLNEVISLAGVMTGLGSDPKVVQPQEPTVGLLDLVRGITASEVQGLVGSFLPIRSGMPRVLYEWR